MKNSFVELFLLDEVEVFLSRSSSITIVIRLPMSYGYFVTFGYNTFWNFPKTGNIFFTVTGNSLRRRKSSIIPKSTNNLLK